MSKTKAYDVLAPALSPEFSQLSHPDDTLQNRNKRHKQGEHVASDYCHLERATDPPSSPMSNKVRTIPPSYSSIQKLQGSGANTCAKKELIPKNPYGGYNKAPTSYEGLAPKSCPSAPMPTYHDPYYSQTYSSEYSRTPQGPYQPEQGQHIPSSAYHNQPTNNAPHAQSRNSDTLSSSGHKRPSSELSTPYEHHQSRHKDSSNRNENGQYPNQYGKYENPNEADRNRYQTKPYDSYNHPSTGAYVKPSPATLPTTEPGAAPWADAPTSYSYSYYNAPPPHYNPHSSHVMHQSSNWYNSGPPTSRCIPETQMAPHDSRSLYTRSPNLHHGAHNIHPHNGQVPPPLPQHFEQRMIASQGANLQQRTNHPLGSSPQSSRFILTLAMNEDESWLSEFLCFIREYCTEVICATQDDVASRMNSKKVILGQVGVRCQFCAHLSHKKRGGRSSTFPSSLSRIYQSLTMMIRDHFEACPAMPADLKEKYKNLRANTSQGIDGSKQYWVDSAKKLGLVDTDTGIFFKDGRHFVAMQQPPQHQWNENDRGYCRAVQQ